MSEWLNEIKCVERVFSDYSWYIMDGGGFKVVLVIKFL